MPSWGVFSSVLLHFLTVSIYRKSAYKEPAYKELPVMRNWFSFPILTKALVSNTFIRNSCYKEQKCSWSHVHEYLISGFYCIICLRTIFVHKCVFVCVQGRWSDVTVVRHIRDPRHQLLPDPSPTSNQHGKA